MDASLFDWIAWRRGDPLVLFGVPGRTSCLLGAADTLRRYAAGWCPAESLVCRPKRDHVAVMFEKDGEQGWFHLRRPEFDAIFVALSSNGRIFGSDPKNAGSSPAEVAI